MSFASPEAIAVVTGQPVVSGPPPLGLVDLFQRMREDARSDPKPAEVAQPFTIDISFDGVGQLPLVNDVLLVPLGKISAVITGAVLVADGIGSATIDVHIGNVTSWPTAQPLSVLPPSLDGLAALRLDTTTWVANIQPDDILKATLIAVSGLITTVTLVIECRRLKWPVGSADITTSDGSAMTTSSGNSLTFRQ